MILLLIAVAVIVMFVLAFIVFGLALKLLWWALIGLAIGGLARLVLPRQAGRSACWPPPASGSPACCSGR